MPRIKFLSLILFSLLILSACGGGSDEEYEGCQDPNFVGPCKSEQGPEVPSPASIPASWSK